MTVSAAAKRNEEARVSEGGGSGKGGTAPPPSSFRAVALVGAPRYVSAATTSLDVMRLLSYVLLKFTLTRGAGRGWFVAYSSAERKDYADSGGGRTRAVFFSGLVGSHAVPAAPH